jgi:hypothetical protein
VQARSLQPQPDALSQGCLRLIVRAEGRPRPIIDEAQRRSTTLLDRGPMTCNMFFILDREGRYSLISTSATRSTPLSAITIFPS